MKTMIEKDRLMDIEKRIQEAYERGLVEGRNQILEENLIRLKHESAKNNGKMSSRGGEYE
jgi:uncharacterized protein YjcR